MPRVPSPALVVAVLVISGNGCSYDFGGAPDGDGGAAASSSITGLTNAQATSGTGTQPTSSTTTTATTVGPASGSGVAPDTSSTGMVEVPYARCTGFSDPFDGDQTFWSAVLPYYHYDAGSLIAEPGDTQGVVPFDLGGRISQDDHVFDECTLSITGLDIVSGGAKPSIGVFQFTGEFLGLAWDGDGAQRRSRDGAAGSDDRGTSVAVGAQISRLTMHFTGGVVRLYADDVLVEEVARPGWLNGNEFLFAGAVDSGEAALQQFNDELYPSDLL